ncbi:MAG: hypothetical protein KIT83_03465 [Bryobacterales bacterium]|nr:hypothetical protein [Bryobacterales bacterium]
MPAPSTNRLLLAMLLYGGLAASSFFTLDGNVRIFVLILFVGLAVKTWAVHEREKLEAAEEEPGDGGEDPTDPREG